MFRIYLDWWRLAIAALIILIAGILMAPPWHGSAPFSLMLKMPFGIMVAVIVAWLMASDCALGEFNICAEGLLYPGFSAPQKRYHVRHSGELTDGLCKPRGGDSMVSGIAHRGPDDRGYGCLQRRGTLGHARLSIVDLSPAGHSLCLIRTTETPLCSTRDLQFPILRKDCEAAAMCSSPLRHRGYPRALPTAWHRLSEVLRGSRTASDDDIGFLPARSGRARRSRCVHRQVRLPRQELQTTDHAAVKPRITSVSEWDLNTSPAARSPCAEIGNCRSRR